MFYISNIFHIFYILYIFYLLYISYLTPDNQDQFSCVVCFKNIFHILYFRYFIYLYFHFYTFYILYLTIRTNLVALFVSKIRRGTCTEKLSKTKSARRRTIIERNLKYNFQKIEKNTWRFLHREIVKNQKFK